MSFYNALFGENEHAVELLECLGLERSEIPRYRDCFLHKGHIVIYTRSGGPNWKDYEAQNESLKSHPYFLIAGPCDADKTYALFYFKINEPFPVEWETALPGDKWIDLQKRQKSGGPFSEREQKFNNQIADKLKEINQINSKNQVRFNMIDKEDVDNPGVIWVHL